MSDALAETERRMLSNSGSGCGASWLCPDELGSGFTFLEDRTAGREKIIKMVNQQVTYFQFLMSKLPVNSKDLHLPYPGMGSKVTDAVLGCVPADNPIAFGKHEEAAKFFFLGVQFFTYNEYFDVDSIRKRTPDANIGNSESVSNLFQQKIKDWTAEGVVDTMIKYPLTNEQIAQRQTFFQQEFIDDRAIGLVNKRTNPRWLCFPMGNDVPLRQTPLNIDEIKGTQWFWQRQQGQGSRPGGRFDPDEFDYDPVSGAKTAKAGPAAPEKVQRYRSNFTPALRNNQGGAIDTTHLPDCIKYKMIADFPYDVFGWKTDAQGRPSINLFMNDLFNEYLKYLGNPNMSFDMFRNNVPKEIILGESGNPVPAHCLAGTCEEWEKQGFANYGQWIAFIIKNQSANLNPEDVELTGTIDMNEEFKLFFEKAHPNYATNPEFMPAYQQIIRWGFSNSCFDDPSYMTLIMINSDNRQETFYFTQDSYNYILSILVKTRFENFIRDLLVEKWEWHYTDLGGTWAFSGYLWEESQASRDYNYIIQNPEDTLTKIYDNGFVNAVPKKADYRKSNGVVSIDYDWDRSKWTARKDKFKDTVKKFFLIPEDTDTTIVGFKDVINFAISIAKTYKLSLTNISEFNPAAVMAKQTASAGECIAKQKWDIEGIPMTATQRGDYRTNLARILYNNWAEIARIAYEKYETNLHDSIDNANWIREHPILQWMKENILNDIVTPIMDIVVSGSMLADTGILGIAGFAGAGPIGLFMLGLSLALINTTWETMAPAGSLYYKNPPLSAEEILKQLGIQIGLAVAGEAAGLIAAELVPIMFNITAGCISSMVAKIQRGMGLLCEDSETLLANIANNRAAFSRLSHAGAADSGFSKAFQEFNQYKGEMETIFRYERNTQTEAFALKKQLKDISAKNIEILESKGGNVYEFSEIKSVLDEEKAIAKRIDYINKEIASADKAVEFQRVIVLRNQLAIETAAAKDINSELNTIFNKYNTGGRKDLLDQYEIVYSKKAKLEVELEAARGANNIDLANDLQLQLEKANKSFQEVNDELMKSFANPTGINEIAEQIKLISDSQKAIADIDLKTNEEFFKMTDAYQAKISELALELEKAAQGNAASSQIARLASDINKSKGTVELARLYYDKAKDALIRTNTDEVLTYSRALATYEKASKAYYDAVETQFYYSNMSSLVLSYVSEWPDPTRMANFGALVLKAFITGFTVEAKGYFENWVERKVLNVGHAFGLEMIAQTSNTLLNTMAHYFCQQDYKKLPIPNFGEDYPVLSPSTESVGFNLEMYRLRHDFIEPILETYILINALIDMVGVATKNHSTMGFWHKYFDYWMTNYLSEDEYHSAAHPINKGVPYTMRAYITRVETAPDSKGVINFVDKAAWEKSVKTNMEKYVDPFDMVWKMKEERTRAYIEHSYALMDKYAGVHWTSEELSKFPPSTIPDYVKPPE